MNRRVFAVAGLLTLAVSAPAAAKSAGIAVRDAVVRPAAAGQPVTAAYMTLVNSGDRPVRLTGVHCDCAATVTAHESRLVDGVMQMRPVEGLTVAPHTAVRFEPGGLHLMVMGLTQAIAPGAGVTLRLSFDHAPPVTARFVAVR